MTKHYNNSHMILCVDGEEGSVLTGRFYPSDLTCEYPFFSIDRFFLAADAILNGEKAAIPGKARKNTEIWQAGKIATFKIHIRYRRNADWQGSVMWVETRHEEHFRSVLELLYIIHQAMGPARKQRMCPSSLKLMR